MSKTVQGVCTDCWGSKGSRQFWPHGEQRGLSVSPYLVGGGLALLLPLTVLALWILA